MRSMLKGLAMAVAVGLAAPAAAGDMEDTVTEKKAELRKDARDVKADIKGGKTADDHVEDAKDTVDQGVAKTKKTARKAGREVKEEAHEATN